MAIYIDDSEGKRFVRYTSLDSKESVEEYVADSGLVVDWSKVLLSSTGVINGRPIEMYRLPIIDGSPSGTLSADFPSWSLLVSLARELQGDGFTRALHSYLEVGHKIMRVTIEPATDLQPVQYVFLLYRQETFTFHRVPAGQLPVEKLLSRRGQRLASEGDESLRVEFLLKRSGEPFAVWGSATSQMALRLLAKSIGGPRCQGAEGSPLDEESIIQAPLQAMLAVLQSEVRQILSDLVLGLNYRLEEAGSILDTALAAMIKSG